MLLSVTDTTAIDAAAHARGCVRRASGLVLTRKPDTIRGVGIVPPSGHAEHHERHIIVLGSGCGKRLCGGQDSTHAFQRWKPMTRFRKFDQSLFSPFFVSNVHGFGNSVRKHYRVSGLMRKHASLILLWEKPDHRTTGFQA
jgi:hypothetical protein